MASKEVKIEEEEAPQISDSAELKNNEETEEGGRGRATAAGGAAAVTSFEEIERILSGEQEAAGDELQLGITNVARG